MDYGLYVKSDSFKKAWSILNYKAFMGNPEHISSNAHYFNCLMIVTNPGIEDINLGYIGYTKMKFRNLLNLYWNEEEFQEFIARLHHYKNESRKGKDYVVSLGMKFNSRKNRTGSCLQFISVGQSPTRGWIINVHTRANEIAQRLYADMVLIQCFLKKLSNVMDIPLNEMTVYWHIDAVYQSVIGCNLWLAMTFPEYKIKEFMNKDDNKLTKWQKRVKDRYLKNFNLDKDKRKVYNYSVQQRATECFDKILENKIDIVPMNDLMNMLPEFDYSEELYNDLFNHKGGGR